MYGDSSNNQDPSHCISNYHLGIPSWRVQLSCDHLKFFDFLFLSLSFSQEYQGSSVLGQFVTRFMLRETSGQLLSLQRSLQCALEAVEEQSSPAP